MKALIMSDSHGWTEEVQQVVDRHKNEVDVMFHCGDSELKADAPCLQNVRTVRGNCDFDSTFKEELVEEVVETRFFVAHGHLLNVKMTEMNLLFKGEETGADIICYGHTHIPVAVQEKGKVIINPGSMRLPRQVKEGTYVILEATDATFHVTFFNMDGEKVENLSKSFSKIG
ncbi:metallophosphoesterase [Bacillus shivajii]|uniref:metallophosphoesterase family protein n=1 Tax=Bacillus shivajii TaxID=1983719 RepID=UPI001CFA8355|nr:metallophosphoesterase [Bacillus shivajii]UCZ52152.1 metallophosphoesterase [Bacillus shivajii]